MSRTEQGHPQRLRALRVTVQLFSTNLFPTIFNLGSPDCYYDIWRGHKRLIARPRHTCYAFTHRPVMKTSYAIFRFFLYMCQQFSCSRSQAVYHLLRQLVQHHCTGKIGRIARSVHATPPGGNATGECSKDVVHMNMMTGIFGAASVVSLIAAWLLTRLKKYNAAGVMIVLMVGFMAGFAISLGQSLTF